MTLSYDYVGTVRGNIQNIPNYVTSVSNDNTDPFNGKWIDNRDGKISRIAFGTVATAGSTAATLTVTLEGSLDGTNAFTVLDSAGNAVATSALALTGASVTVPVTEFEDTNQEGISKFPPFVRLNGNLSSAGTWNGTISMMVDRTPVKEA